MMAEESWFRSHLVARNYRAIAVELVRWEAERGLVSIPALGNDPERALEEHPEVRVEYDTSPKAGCSVFGYYRPSLGGQAIIFIHPALTAERDAFTIVHEYGHHVQRQHAQWASVRHSLTTREGTKVEERVADAFAAEVLIPATAIGEGSLTAAALSELYSAVRASRAAVAMRAAEIVASDEQATLVVLDRRGVVTFARACGDDVFVPARGRVQHDLALMVSEAASRDGRASGRLAGGLQFASGWAQQDLRAEVALDETGTYAFGVIRPVQRFGRKPVWERVEWECARTACGLVFVVDETIEHCDRCDAPKCPDCSTCQCEPPQAAVCNGCFMELSSAERDDPSLHDCV
ncbi:ImmA/IrrE family metallo-endopeptidase [Agromyces sp. NPDC049794]|uniref:ImmA/IrrE family metallo-endopeptidase n=1 Tax=unclassified Agromyces TaxID=2639701 RepID=UPI0033CFE3A1